jgi:anti-sigma-K factor RskA
VNTKEYISSGVIESYVMGLLTEAECLEFENVCAQYSEVVTARNAFEMALEEQLLNDAKQLPQHLKQQVLDKIRNRTTDINNEELEEERAPVRSIGIWKWLAAASFILLAGAAYWGITTNNKYQNLLTQNKQLKDSVQQSTAMLDLMKQDAEMLQKPGIKMAALMSDHSSAYATIYWDTASATKDVYLMINNLPQPASDKQYQLWALLDGKPIDLGMIVAKQRLLTKMKNVQNAQAFAITLEPMGGSVAPTSTPISVSNL